MNINRLRPPKDCPDLELWLSSVVWDAIRDAREAGLDDEMIAALIRTIAGMLAMRATR